MLLCCIPCVGVIIILFSSQQQYNSSEAELSRRRRLLLGKCDVHMAVWWWCVSLLQDERYKKKYVIHSFSITTQLNYFITAGHSSLYIHIYIYIYSFMEFRLKWCSCIYIFRLLLNRTSPMYNNNKHNSLLQLPPSIIWCRGITNYQ